MNEDKNPIQYELLKMQDAKYRDFQSALMPTVDKNTIIGVRTPLLREYAKKIYGTAQAEQFLKELPHKFYEENNLHAFLIERIPDFDTAVKAVSEFLPFVDNWATCDSLSPKVFKKEKASLLKYIDEWLNSKQIYAVRFGIKMYMCHFLDDSFNIEHPKRVAKIKSDEYYIKMMISWYFATALAKQYDSIIPFFEQRLLDPWVHNKAIQKARESYRITKEQKQYLKTLKI